MKEKDFLKQFGIKHTKPFGDLDHDRAPNMLDCEPRNSKKQGLIGDIRQKIAVRREESRKLRAERREEEFITATKAEEARKEAREKQAIKTAVFREERRGERERARIKSGGAIGAIGRGFGQIGAGIMGPAPRPATRRVKVTTKKGKKRKGKGKFRTIITQPKPFNPLDIGSDLF